jgi:Holliday junction resolvase
MSEETVVLRLSKDEALVLYEFVSRFGARERVEVKDRAEERALWNLEALLEKELVEPFAPDYAELVERAKARLS